MITSADEAASKKHLIQECQNEVEGIWKDVKGEATRIQRVGLKLFRCSSRWALRRLRPGE